MMNDRRYNFAKIKHILNSLRIESIKDSFESEDYLIELAEETTITSYHYPNTWLAFISVSDINKATIQNETHGFGYHIHFILNKVRTNVIFLFDRDENDDFNSLYWEHHHEASKKKENPDTYGYKRK
ncbi:hypothetical protein SBF1_3190002 [Candidatus Desulfosporosinus infrequens]|uniref:Uncharacterized protein n=1 Tax=Candidatus Desulfosporosinus infrequens TaxID=2043169 RepID=A0A2U3KZM3_9FIRM|nr:hypothetical protein SBF1_3190002 [Candidatus Desulfosporosinus infrequens]